MDPEKTSASSDTELIAQAKAVGSGEVSSALPDEAPSWWSTHDAMTMSASVLVFGVAVIGLSAWLAIRKIEKDVILKIVVIPMVVMSAVFLLVAGYTDMQMAPIVGLLGTIVGYILGNGTKSEGPAPEPKPEAGGAPV